MRWETITLYVTSNQDEWWCTTTSIMWIRILNLKKTRFWMILLWVPREHLQINIGNLVSACHIGFFRFWQLSVYFKKFWWNRSSIRLISIYPIRNQRSNCLNIISVSAHDVKQRVLSPKRAVFLSKLRVNEDQ